MFDDIENKSESLMRIVLLREKHVLTKMHVQAEHLYFYLHFALDIILGDRWDKKNTKINFFIQIKPHLLVVEFSKKCYFLKKCSF